MFKATYYNNETMSKRQANDYLNKCESKLKENCKEYVCLEKIRKHPNYEIIFTATAIRGTEV